MTSPRSQERLKLLETLVRLHSGSRNPAGVEKVQLILAEKLRALGFQIQWEENPKSEVPSARFLIASYPGQSDETIDLVSHADTVEEGQAEASAFRFDSSLNRAIGRGALDDKGAQVMALEALELWVKSLNGKKPKRTLRFLSSPLEELGSPGFGPLLEKLGQQAKLVLGLEPALENGNVIESRRGNRWYFIEVEGRTGHSGRDFLRGVNAAHDLVSRLSKIQALSDPARELSVSVGSLRTESDAYNVIPERASAKVDTRFASFTERDLLHSQIESELNAQGQASPTDGLRPKAQYRIDDDCPPFPSNPQVQPLINAYAKIVAGLEGQTPKSERGGGAADCCYMSRPGLWIMDGLGPRGGRMHAEDEWVDLGSLETRAEALHQFLIGPVEAL